MQEAELNTRPAGKETSVPAAPAETKRAESITDLWPNYTSIAENNFRYKSLSNWSLNTAIGCAHGCLFCYVPSTSVNKQTEKLKELGVTDPDEQ
jgi:DNA repair photolyase